MASASPPPPRWAKSTTHQRRIAAGRWSCSTGAEARLYCCSACCLLSSLGSTCAGPARQDSMRVARSGTAWRALMHYSGERVAASPLIARRISLYHPSKNVPFPSGLTSPGTSALETMHCATAAGVKSLRDSDAGPAPPAATCPTLGGRRDIILLRSQSSQSAVYGSALLPLRCMSRSPIENIYGLPLCC